MGYLRTFFWIFFPLFLPGCYLQQYQWKCSPLDENNLYTLPDLGESDSDLIVMVSHGLRIRLSSPGITYIYPVNSAEINCSGTVTALDFCYRAFASDLGSNSLVFTLSLLQGNGGIDYTVTNTVEVRGTSSSSDCSRDIIGSRFCCEIFTLSPQDQFNLPSPNFAFGITIPSSGNINMFGLSPGTYSNLTAGQYQLSVAPVVGGVYSFPSNSLVVSETLKWLKFLISPLQSSTVSPAATVASSAVEISSPSNTGLIETSKMTSTTVSSHRISSDIIQSVISMPASSVESTQAVTSFSGNNFISSISTVIFPVNSNVAPAFESSAMSVAVPVKRSTTMVNFMTALVATTSKTAVENSSQIEQSGPSLFSLISLQTPIPSRSTIAVEHSSSSLLSLTTVTPAMASFSVIVRSSLSRITAGIEQSSLSLLNIMSALLTSSAIFTIGTSMSAIEDSNTAGIEQRSTRLPIAITVVIETSFSTSVDFPTPQETKRFSTPIANFFPSPNISANVVLPSDKFESSANADLQSTSTSNNNGLNNTHILIIAVTIPGLVVILVLIVFSVTVILIRIKANAKQSKYLMSNANHNNGIILMEPNEAYISAQEVTSSPIAASKFTTSAYGHYSHCRNSETEITPVYSVAYSSIQDHLVEGNDYEDLPPVDGEDEYTYVDANKIVKT